MSGVITEADLDRWLDAHAEDPRVNPTWGGVCCYTNPEQPDQHCLVGQFLVDQGLPAERLGEYDDEGCDAFTVVADLNKRGFLIPNEVSDRLQQIQFEADQDCAPWAHVIAAIRKNDEVPA